MNNSKSAVWSIHPAKLQEQHPEAMRKVCTILNV